MIDYESVKGVPYRRSLTNHNISLSPLAGDNFARDLTETPQREQDN